MSDALYSGIYNAAPPNLCQSGGGGLISSEFSFLNSNGFISTTLHSDLIIDLISLNMLQICIIWCQNLEFFLAGSSHEPLNNKRAAFHDTTTIPLIIKSFEKPTADRHKSSSQSSKFKSARGIWNLVSHHWKSCARNWLLLTVNNIQPIKHTFVPKLSFKEILTIKPENKLDQHRFVISSTSIIICLCSSFVGSLVQCYKILPVTLVRLDKI